MENVFSSPCSATEEILGFPGPAPALVHVLVLAGGEGRRMGGGKPDRLLGGKRLIAHALAIAHALSPAVAVGVRDADQVLAYPDQFCVEDDPVLHGPLASLAAGLRWARARGALWLQTLPCDAPFLPGDLAIRLLYAAIAQDAAVALPRSAERVHPTCGLWRCDLAEKIAAYARTGQSSLYGFAEHAGVVIADWEVGAGDPFFNVNTPADLAAAEQRLPYPHLE